MICKNKITRAENRNTIAFTPILKLLVINFNRRKTKDETAKHVILTTDSYHVDFYRNRCF